MYGLRSNHNQNQIVFMMFTIDCNVNKYIDIIYKLNCNNQNITTQIGMDG